MYCVDQSSFNSRHFEKEILPSRWADHIPGGFSTEWSDPHLVVDEKLKGASAYMEAHNENPETIILRYLRMQGMTSDYKIQYLLQNLMGQTTNTSRAFDHLIDEWLYGLLVDAKYYGPAHLSEHMPIVDFVDLQFLTASTASYFPLPRLLDHLVMTTPSRVTKANMSALRWMVDIASVVKLQTDRSMLEMTLHRIMALSPPRYVMQRFLVGTNEVPAIFPEFIERAAEAAVTLGSIVLLSDVLNMSPHGSFDELLPWWAETISVPYGGPSAETLSAMLQQMLFKGVGKKASISRARMQQMLRRACMDTSQRTTSVRARRVVNLALRAGVPVGVMCDNSRAGMSAIGIKQSSGRDGTKWQTFVL